MPKVDDMMGGNRATIDIPDTLKPYTSHGVKLDRSSNGEWIGECPFCGREKKFSVVQDSGVWRCFVCNAGTEKGGGNAYTFIRLLWEESDKLTKEYKTLASERKLFDPDTLMYWGAVKSLVSGNWLVPGYNHEGKIVQLYRYIKIGEKKRLLPTPGFAHGQSHGIYRPTTYDGKKDTVYLCEGYWDACCLWETLRVAREDNVRGEKVYRHTVSKKESILADANVLGVPGANVFNDMWRMLFKDKHVVLMYHNDYPKRNHRTGVVSAPTGDIGMKRVAAILGTLPKSISYLHWGDEGYTLGLPDGYDIRDHLPSGEGKEKIEIRVEKNLPTLMERIREVPDTWIEEGRKLREQEDMDILPCQSWDTLIEAWKKAFTWTEGLDRTLSVMLAVAISTELMGDQLWTMVIGPPSSGKSTLCEAITIAKKYVYSKDTFTGLVSGYQVDKDGKENLSLVSQIKNKTLVINDGDTLLRLPNRDQVLSQMRAFYGRNIRTQYGNKMSKDHEGINTTIILAGTRALYELDSSELGSRFIISQIMDNMDEELEDDIGWSVAMRANIEATCKSDGKIESRDTPEIAEAKRLTAGYLVYLRSNILELVKKAEFEEENMKKCQRLAKFVAYARARPPKKHEEESEREMSFRLIAQYVRLARCLATVMQKDSVDDEVMKRIIKVAMDTARGQTMELVNHIYRNQKTGISLYALSVLLNRAEEKLKSFLIFLYRIGMIRFERDRSGARVHAKWKLSDRFLQLYEVVRSYAKYY